MFKTVLSFLSSIFRRGKSKRPYSRQTSSSIPVPLPPGEWKEKPPYEPVLPKKQREMAEDIELVLDLMERTKPEKQKGRRGMAIRNNLSYFSPAEIFTINDADAKWHQNQLMIRHSDKLLSTNNEDGDLHMQLNPSCIPHLDMSCLDLSPETEDAIRHPEDDILTAILWRLRKVSLKQIRGKYLKPYQSTYLIDATCCAGASGDETLSLNTILSFIEGVWAVNASAEYQNRYRGHGEERLYKLSGTTGLKVNPWFDTWARILTSLCLAKEYQWRVCIGYEKGLQIAFPTDPVGARAVFRLRDIPNGKSRRTALRHWVTDHYRQDYRDSQADEIYVRKHLRGNVKCNWAGLTVHVQVCPYDIKLAERLKEERMEANVISPRKKYNAWAKDDKEREATQ